MGLRNTDPTAIRTIVARTCALLATRCAQGKVAFTPKDVDELARRLDPCGPMGLCPGTPGTGSGSCTGSLGTAVTARVAPGEGRHYRAGASQPWRERSDIPVASARLPIYDLRHRN